MFDIQQKTGRAIRIAAIVSDTAKADRIIVTGVLLFFWMKRYKANAFTTITSPAITACAYAIFLFGISDIT